MATLSPQEIERRRAQSIKDKSMAREMVQRPSQPIMKNTPLPMTPSNPATSQKLPQAPKTVSEQFFSGNREQKNIGTFRNTSENGYTRGNAPLSQTAQDAQKRNTELYNAQQKTVGNVPAPTGLEFGTNVATPQIGTQGQKLEFGTNVATPQVGQDQQAQTIQPTQTTPGMEQPTPTTPVSQGQPTGTQPTGAQPSTDQIQMGAINTGVAQYDEALKQSQGITEMATQFSIDDMNAKKENLKNQFLQSIGATTLDDIARAEGTILSDMTFDELNAYAAKKGIQLDEQEKERIRAGGKAELENLEWSKNTQMALNDLTKRQIEREFGRALEEREQFNVSQDVRMRALMGSFGVQDLASNTQVLKSLDDGVKAKVELVDRFADKITPIALQAQGIIRDYTNNVNQVMSQMAQLEEDKYAEIVGKLQSLADQGVTSETEMRKAVLGEMKDYAKMYNEINEKALNYIQEENKQLFEQTKFFIEEQRKQDENLTNSSGIMYKDGVPVLDEFGNAVPTLDMMKFGSDIDKQLTESTGYVYKNGSLLLDSNKQPIQTFDREKFITTENRLSQQFQMGYGLDVSKFQLDQAKFEQDVAQFGLEYARDQQKLAIEMADKGIVQVQKNMVDPNSGINPEKSLYGMSITADGSVAFNVPADGKAPNGRGQCGEFVNDALGLTGNKRFTNLISEKEKLINSQVPVPGGAFIQRTGDQNGHVGIVTKVYPDGSFDYIDSNRAGNEKIATGRMPANYAEKGVVGFTTGVQSGGVSYQKTATPEEMRKTNISSAIQTGDTYTIAKASAGGKELAVSAVQDLSKARETLRDLQNLEAKIDETFTGPISGALRGANPYDATARELEAQITGLVPGLARGIFGEVGVLTDQDVERYTRMIPNINTPEGAKKLLMTALKDKVNSSLNTTIDSYARGGYDVSGFADLIPQKAPEPTGTDVRMYKDGKAYDIPSDKVSAALFKGYTY